MTAKHARTLLRSLILAGLGVVCVPALARATEVEDFETARAAYNRHEFAEAAALFEAMVGGPIPTIQDHTLIQESRRYLAAAYVFLGDIEAARGQFRELLRVNRDYRLNPAAVPAAVLEVFNDVVERIEEAEEDEEQRRARAERERRERVRQATLRLIDMAAQDEVEVRNDPVLAWIPFGVGQFQNGNEGLGAFFLAAEATTLLGALVTFAVWFPLDEMRSPGGEHLAAQAQAGLQIANWITAGAFGILAVAGVIEAQVNFVPSRRVHREREIPTDILEHLELSLGPGSFALRLRF